MQLDLIHLALLGGYAVLAFLYQRGVIGGGSASPATPAPAPAAPVSPDRKAALRGILLQILDELLSAPAPAAPPAPASVAVPLTVHVVPTAAAGAATHAEAPKPA